MGFIIRVEIPTEARNRMVKDGLLSLIRAKTLLFSSSWS